MIVVSRNAKNRFDKPLRNWLQQNQIAKFNFAQHSLQSKRANFQKICCKIKDFVAKQDVSPNLFNYKKDSTDKFICGDKNGER